MSTALIFGANGISGLATLSELFKSPESEWKKIIAVSRREPVLEHKDPRLTFKSTDLLGDVGTISEHLKEAGGNQVTDVFFYAYIAKEDEKELCEVNEKLLANAIKACAQACPDIKTFQLQTGYKYYGTHLGGDNLAPYPWREYTPRHKGNNFYFIQEDLLKKAAKEYGWKWIITRPNFIIGASKGNFMSMATTLALYAHARKALGQPLVYPGTDAAYTKANDYSTATNDAAFQTYAARNPKAHDRVFNIHDGEQMTFETLWNRTSEYFDIPLADPPATKTDKTGLFKETPHSVAEWASTVDWNDVAKKVSVDPKVFEYATWDFLDFGPGRTWVDQASMDEASSIGWDSKVDTWKDGFVPAFEKLKEEHIIPK